MSRAPLQFESGLRWYATRSKVNREREAERRLKDLGLEVFLPWIRTRRRVGSHFHWVSAPLFPGYFFRRLDMLVSGKSVRYAPGVKDILTFGSRVAEVGKEIIQALRGRCRGALRRRIRR
jgi:hypothetical protein